MDTRLNYRDMIKKILQEHAQYRASLPDSMIPKFYLMMSEDAT
jgi:hypothetical protein